MAADNLRTDSPERAQQVPTTTASAPILNEWKDVEYAPLPVNDVVAIDYSGDFRHLVGLLLTVQHRKERTERCLRLSRAVIQLNKADVTAWLFRRECAQALAREKGAMVWTSELAFVTSIIMSSPKNYQAWEYRRFIACQLQQFDAEVDFVDLVLDSDAKNYHAWSHRQWLVREGRVQSDEMKATQWFISNDVRNNSAWNHRWLLVKNLDLATRNEEMQWALNIVGMAPRNGSAWNFIHALVASGVPSDVAKKSALLFLEKDENNVPARRFLVRNDTLDDAAAVVQHCDVLIKVDPMRCKYWEFKRQIWDRISQEKNTKTRE